MNFEEALTTELSSVTGLSNTVFPSSAPEGAELPFLVYSMADPGYIETLSGPSYTRNSKYEIDILSESYSGMKDIAKGVSDKLLSFIGRTVGGSSIYVQAVYLGTPMESFVDDLKWHHTKIECQIFYEE